VGTVELIALIIRGLTIGVPVVLKAAADFKATNNREPTVQEILAITADLRPPESYT